MCGGGKAPEVEETEAERALAEVSAKQWQDYKTDFVPLENQYMKRVDDINGSANMQNMEASGIAGVNEQVSGSNGKMERSMFAGGIDPTAGKFKTKSAALNSAIRKTAENAGSNARFSAENAHIQGVSNIVSMGNGQEAVALNSMSGLARNATNEAIGDARNDFTKWQGEQELTGAVVGAGTAAASNNIDGVSTGINQANVSSGLKYNTGLMSDQSTQLAQQESGFGVMGR